MNFLEATDAFLNGYFSTCRRSPKTRAAYSIDLAQLREYLGAAEPLANVKPDRLEQWASEMREQKYSTASIRRKFATARVFFTYLVRKGTIDSSPLWRIRLDLGCGRVLPRGLSGPEAKLLLERAWARLGGLPKSAKASDPGFLKLRDLAAVETLFATGIRVGELVALSLPDWCEDEACFLVKGKGNRERLAFLPDDRSLKALQAYLAKRRSLSLDNDAVFVNAQGRRISTQGIARALAEMAKSAGIAKRVTPHMLRHTVATLLLHYGTDIRVVQEVLGHASIATTQRYTYVSKEHMVAALRARHPNHHLGVKAAVQLAA